MSDIPWVEKYRPRCFDNIILNETNQSIFSNIIQKHYFPHMLFYGPPGTGKTTTIINLIDTYYKGIGVTKYNSNVIHLNASDERGIDTIRHQIFQFVNSKSIYVKGIKFVILDEVDYMTKTAQNALKNLLQSCIENVRFCLICNYISKIEYSLKNEFLCIRFNQLPSSNIQQFLKDIIVAEDLKINDTEIERIQKHFSSDIRSMINYIQLNKDPDRMQCGVIDNHILRQFHEYIVSQDSYKKVIQYIHNLSIQFNTSKIEIIKDYFYFILADSRFANEKFITAISNIIHNPQLDIENILIYFSFNLRGIINKIETYKEKDSISYKET
jgi:replication factor C subunit 3/5